MRVLSTSVLSAMTLLCWGCEAPMNHVLPAAHHALTAHRYGKPGTAGGGTAIFNPYLGATGLARRAFADEVMTAIKQRPDLAGPMQLVQQTATALWLDSVARLQTLTPLLDEARQLHQQRGQAVATTIVIYDLPGRDCAANASNGEFAAGPEGLAKYKSYIDQIAAIVAAYPDVRIGAVLEPDSLGNIVTNLGRPQCAAAQSGYIDGIVYAIQSLQFRHVALYLDSAHSGWLGWPNNRSGMATVVKGVLDRAGGPAMIRGFATNVSNYTPLTVTGNPTWYDPSNPAKDELTFQSLMAAAYEDAGVTNHHFVIDTSRNGVIDARQNWGSWCNVRRAGIGQRPTVEPAEGIDAFLWIKPPGEADGTNQGGDPRYDSMCGSSDALTNIFAPQAGEWFEAYFEGLVANAAAL